MDAATDLLMSAFGADKANNIVGRVLQALQVMPFDFLKRADASQIITFIQNEHPQTIALILAYLAAEPGRRHPVGTAAGPARRCRPAHRDAGQDAAGSHPRRRASPAAQAVVGRLHRLHPRGRRQVAGRSPQLGGPLHREDDPRIAVGEQPGDRRRSQEDDVRLRGHHPARRPRDPAGAEGSGHHANCRWRSRASARACRCASSRTCPSAPPP